MVTYFLTATALRAFSFNSTAKATYRLIGNALGGQIRARKPKADYIERAANNLRFIEAQGAIRDGTSVLELGTGWIHWEALFTRLFYDVKIHMLDIWDNRQFPAFKSYLKHLRDNLPHIKGPDQERRARAISLANRALACTDFEQVYRELSKNYVTNEEGRLDMFADDMFDLVISSDVMEHVKESELPNLAQELARTVKSHGYVSQQIVQADHLCIYAKNAHAKSYLQFSDQAWNRWYSNDVQYMNRWQHSDFVRLFESAGFDLVSEEIVGTTDTATISIAPRWQSYEKSDLDATVTRLLVKNLN